MPLIPSDTDVTIVGGGLSGLSLAHLCEAHGVSYQLFEARQRMGGRILGETLDVGGLTATFDLGPTWFWPGQPRMAELLRTLGLQVFEQYSTGDQIFEDQGGQVTRGRGYASMQGSLRVAGGMAAVVAALHARLDPERVHTGQRLLQVQHLLAGGGPDRVAATVVAEGGERTTIDSGHVALALPPRTVAQSVSLSPAPARDAMQAMRDIPTWMAGQAKIVAVYDRPHWREAGLSGDAMSRRGPMVEVHDASPGAGGPYALFGFVGVAAPARRGRGPELLAMARRQLQRLFGDEAASPLHIVLQDWAAEPETATPLDAQPLLQHPDYGMPSPLAHMMGGRLLLASSEVAPQFGGYLEGALEVSAQAFDAIRSRSRRTQ
jgi:monoamine oxidase